MSGITHAKVSGKSDGADPSQVLPSDWNAAHVVTEVDIAAGGDTQNRLTAGLDGSNNPGFLLGGGAAAQDVRLYRSGAGILTFDVSTTSNEPTLFIGPPHLDVQSSSMVVYGGSSDGGAQVGLINAYGDSYPQIELTTSGYYGQPQIIFGPGTTPDVRLYRSDVSILSIDNGTGGAGNGAAIRLSAMTSPGTPAAGYGYLYFSSVDKKLHVVNDAGVDTALG